MDLPITQQVQIGTVKDQDAQAWIVCNTSPIHRPHPYHVKGGILAVPSQRVKPLKSWGSSRVESRRGLGISADLDQVEPLLKPCNHWLWLSCVVLDPFVGIGVSSERVRY